MNFFIILLVLIFFIIFLNIIRFLFVKKYKKQNKEKYVLLKIKSDPTNEIWPIWAEWIFSAIHWSLDKRSFSDWFIKKEETKVSFEFWVINQKIALYIFCNEKQQNTIEGQLYAQYPNIEIEKVEDYSKKWLKIKVSNENPSTGSRWQPISSESQNEKKQFKEIFDTSTAIWAELKLTNPYIFPIKRYVNFEDSATSSRIDPIAWIFAWLSRLNATDEQIWIQISTNPIWSIWRSRWQELMKSLSSGLFAHAPWLENSYSLKFLDIWWWKRVHWLKAKLMKWFLWWYGRWVWAETQSEESAEENVDKSKETPSIAASSKIARMWFKTNIRIIYLPKKENQYLAENKLKEVVSSFYQFNLMQLNWFEPKIFNKSNKLILKRFQNRAVIRPDILNTEELATIWHIPENTVKTPNLETVTSKKLEWPLNLPSPDIEEKTNFTSLWKTNFRWNWREFWIKNDDRRRHIYIIWKTWMWKSTILENMIFSDIQAWKWVSVIDPHWDLAEAVLSFIPKSRVNDVVLFDPADSAFPVSFNMLECKNPDQFDIVASWLLWVFKKMYAESWGPRLEHILRNTILALVEVEWTTMLWILRMLSDEKYRLWISRQIKNPTVASFWNEEFARMQDRQRIEAIAPIQNKVWQFLSSSLIRNIFWQKKSTIDLRFAMDKKKIIVVNLSKWKIWEDNSSLLWSMMITKFQIDAMSRANVPEKERIDHYLYVDEFQNFATDSFATILSEARKYRLNLTMANQYISQMSDEVKWAVFWNVGSMVTFQVWYDDALYFENQFSEEVSSNDIVSIPKYNTYMKIMVDGMPTSTFSASTLPPPDINHDVDLIWKTIKVSRERYWRPREKVEEDIIKWSNNLS